MKVRMATLEDLRNYLRGMMVEGRVGDSYPRIQHANNISELLVQLLTGALIMWADTNSISIGSNVGRLANTIWFAINSRQFCLIYSGGSVELRERNRYGETLARWTNSDYADVPGVFHMLATPPARGRFAQAAAE